MNQGKMSGRKDEVHTQSIWRLLLALCSSVTILPLLIFEFIEAYKRRRMKHRLRDKVVLITGASSGLGEALAHAFYRLGCRVVLAARRENELIRVKEALMTTYSTAITHPPVVLPLDLSDLNSLPLKVTDLLKIVGHIDILINNGGISYRGNVLTTAVDVDIKLMLINYFGQVALTKAILPSMVQRRCGHIVAVSSVQGKIAIPYRSAYAASKHALQAFFDTLRSEVTTHNINVTVISPGYISTALSVNALTGSGSIYGVMDATTKNGYSPEQVAEDIVFAVVEGRQELIDAPLLPRLAILLRTLWPNSYFWIMKKRAQRHEEG